MTMLTWCATTTIGWRNSPKAGQDFACAADAIAAAEKLSTQMNWHKLDHIQTVEKPLGKPTNSPTLRWDFQCFMANHLLMLKGSF
ncbi:MAG TPA: hypothetical protein DCZ88_06055 [Pseudanabaena sp.]|nr:hypothetical protein [Pseudanabaena sp.]